MGIVSAQNGYRPMRKLPKVLSPAEQAALLDVFDLRYPTPRRNRTMIAVALATGLRASELTHLRLEHVDMTTGRVIVREGKGAKDRLVWMRPEVIDELAAWFEVRPASDWLFCTSSGAQVSPVYLRRMVKKYATKAGVAEAAKVSTHTLRHTFATALYKRTKDIRLTQKALGHSSITTTMIYTHIVDDDLEAAMRWG